MSEAMLAEPGTAAYNQFRPLPVYTCVPAMGAAHHELHWLAFVAPDGPAQFPLRVECELWRWHDGQWRSVFVPGTRFTPEELHEHGWRYCRPCEPFVAVLRS